MLSGPPEAIRHAARIITELTTTGYSLDLYGSGNIAEDILVEANEVGRVIGPSRKYLNDIKAYSGLLEFRIPDKNPRDRTQPKGSPYGKVAITLIGTRDAVAKAKPVVEELRDQGSSIVTHPDWGRLNLDVPVEDLWILIGQGGKTIQGIQAAAPQCRIKVPKRGTEDTGIVTVVGPNEELHIAEQEIRKALEVKPVEKKQQEAPTELDDNGHNPWQATTEPELW